MNGNFSEQHPIWQEWMDLYLRGEADETVTASLKNWVGASKENARLFEAFLQSYKADVPAWAATIPVEQHWQALRTRINVSDAKIVSIKSRKSRTLRLVIAGTAAAAAIALVLVFRGATKAEYQTFEAFATPINVVLPDSTVVYLNKNSKVRFLPGFGKQHRNIEQTGQAFYQVMPNTRVSFKVKTSHSVVKVLGTSFDLKSYAEDGAEQLAVLSGAVSYEPAGNAGGAKVLRAGQSATLANGTAAVNGDFPEKQLYWNGNLVFENEKLENIARVLESYYKVKITLGQVQLGGSNFTGTFEREELKEVLDVICYSLNLRYTKTGNQYIIDQPK